MRLKVRFELMKVGDSVTAVPVGSDDFHGILELNEVGADILRAISDAQSEEQALACLYATYPDDDRNFIKSEFDRFAQTLENEGLLIR